MTPLSIVVAYARKTRAISYRTLLPWPGLNADLNRFAQLTTPHAIILGRKTFYSPDYGSQALPNRRNIVLSKDAGWAPPSGVVHASDWEEALQLADTAFGGAGYHNGDKFISPDEARTPRRRTFVIGGESVYRQVLSMPSCTWVFATEVEGNWPGDKFFPKLDEAWKRIPATDCPAGWASDKPLEDNGVSFSFVTYHLKTHSHSCEAS